MSESDWVSGASKKPSPTQNVILGSPSDALR